MPSETTEVRCPNCGALISVDADWRLVQCPQCGHPVIRMDSDPSYD